MYANMNKLRSKIKGINGGKMLDIATGQGLFLNELLENIESYDIAFGCDISKNALNRARELLKDKRAFLLMSGDQHLPFLDDEFDFVSISNGLHHFEEVDKSIEEAIRVLKSGGMLFINEMTIDEMSEPQKTFNRYHDLTMRVGRHVGEPGRHTSYTEEEVKALFQEKHDLIELKEEFMHSEDKTNFINPEEIKIVSSVIDQRVESVKDKSDYDEIKQEAEKIKEKLRKDGIHRLNQLVMVYTKR